MPRLESDKTDLHFQAARMGGEEECWWGHWPGLGWELEWGVSDSSSPLEDWGSSSCQLHAEEKDIFNQTVSEMIFRQYSQKVERRQGGRQGGKEERKEETIEGDAKGTCGFP